MLDLSRQLTIRAGRAGDEAILLALFDEAVAWMVARGQRGQWGSEPFSGRPAARARVVEMVRSGNLRIAELDGEPVGALVLGDHPAHVSPGGRPERYINLLLTSRRHAGRRIGSVLVARALAEARAAGCEQVRVDCWAGAPALGAWYERQGFEPTTTFEVNDGWRGQVFVIGL
jgi:GNAT superfamily N-acetyltransferase